jgi:hypothetical protein
MLIGTLCLPIILSLPDTESFREEKKRTSRMQILISTLYVLVALISVQDGSQVAICSKENIVPWAFKANIVIFGLSWSYNYYYASHNYFIKWDFDVEYEQVKGALFINQSQRYQVLTNYLLKWHLVEIILGALIARRNMACSDEGTQWAYKNIAGEFFFNMHCVGCLVGAAMVRTVLIKTLRNSPVWLY